MTNHTSMFSPMDESEDKGGSEEISEQKPESPKPVSKENSYYLEQYEATVTVHKSPPQQRRQVQVYDFLEIDDETTHEFEPVYTPSRLSKRKNLRVTFSDHIEIDVIEGVDDYGYSPDYFARSDVWTQAAKGGDSPEPNRESPVDVKSDKKHAKLISLDVDVLSPRQSPGIPQRSSSSLSARVNTNSANPERTVLSASQPLLQKRKQQPQQQQQQQQDQHRSSLSELEKRTKESIARLNAGRYKRPTSMTKSQGQLLPDLLKSVPQSSYSHFINKAKKMVEVTRRYERPWAVGQSAPSWPRGGQSVRRSASLPKNFRLPDNLPRLTSSLTNRPKIKNS